MQNLLRVPVARDNKYSRGVVGFFTGSEDFIGAAILGVTAALDLAEMVREVVADWRIS